jgi:hypothetical protein
VYEFCLSELRLDLVSEYLNEHISDALVAELSVTRIISGFASPAIQLSTGKETRKIYLLS